MVTAKERKDAASGFRKTARFLGSRMDAHEFAHYAADVLDTGGNMSWQDMMYCLADLVSLPSGSIASRSVRLKAVFEGPSGYGVYCSACGYRFGDYYATRDVADFVVSHPGALAHYCPECGSKIEEG